MVATIARRRVIRPELDEPCPDWARPLLPLCCSESGTPGLGIANARVPQETALALQDLFPAPPAPKRERKREVTERRYKPYVKAWAAAVYFSLLPYALARQISLFPASGEQGSADVGVLCFRRLSDLANKLGLSYDRLQKWMTVLLVLGFVKRYRDGRQVLYVLPLTAYLPYPSPEEALKKLNALIESQFIEERLPDGRVVWRDRGPEWTAQLIEIRTRFEVRYQLPPTVLATAELQAGQLFQEILHEISEALPEALRPDAMGKLFPILARLYLGSGSRLTESTSGSQQLYGSRSDEFARPGEASAAAGYFSSNLDTAMGDRGSAHGAAFTASGRGVLNPHLASAAADGQSRFDGARFEEGISPNSLQSGASRKVGQRADVDSVAGESLTLRYNNSNSSSEDKKDVNVRDAESQLKAENRKKAELLATLLRVPGNINFYTKLFNQASRGELGEDLIKAIFIYTLNQERAGDITDQEPDALGKYFYGVYKRWSPCRTYDAACRAYTKKWHGKTPQGVKPRDRAIIEPFMAYDFEQIADMIRRGVRAEEVGWLPLSSTIEVPAQPMDRDEAEALAQAMREQAAWYLQDLVCRLTFARETSFHVVDAWQDGRPVTFTSRAEWQTFHEQMLTPPPELDPWAGDGAVGAREEGEAQGPGGSRAHEVACARAARALYAYFNQRPVGIMGNLDWVLLASYLSLEELERLGEPIRFPHERGGEAQEPYQGPVAHEGLNVELAEGGVLTYEQFQVLLATGGYHGECVELESGAFIPRERYEELLASGEYVELDDGTPVSASDYAVLTERVRVELEREEAARRRAEDPPGELGEQAEQVQVATVLQSVETDRPLHGGLPGWWEELSRDLAESEGACIDTEAVRRYQLLLQEALAPQLYRLLARPVRTEDALCFALELSSLCSGWVLTFEKTAQVEKLLALLKAQLGADEESQQPESALS